MILVDLIIILLVGGILSWVSGHKSAIASRWIALTAVLADLVIMVVYWISHYDAISLSAQHAWVADIRMEWLPGLGSSFHLAMDGLSLVMTMLTLILGAISILVSWKEIKAQIGFFHFNVLWLLAGILGVFLAMDLLLFYFFWEVMLVPMYFILIIWGHQNRKYAGLKFFLFTQLSGLLMLIAIVSLYVIHGKQSGQYTFDYYVLLRTDLTGEGAFWLMGGFLIAFVVKMPIVPFHSWLPDAYTQAPTAGSVILAALMSKTGAYGILRFVLPLFGEAARSIAFVGVLLGVVGILYGAKMAFAQTDLKRLISFSSISHMGFVMVGIFSFQTLAYQGVVMQMVAHGLSISALFIIAEAVRERTHILDMRQMGGFWEDMPKMGGMTVLFVMASLGLPGFANFMAEFLILAGAWQTHTILTVLASVGLIVSVIYSLVILQKVFHGTRRIEQPLFDFTTRELIVMSALVILIIGLGIFPQTVVQTTQPVFQRKGYAPDKHPVDKGYNAGTNIQQKEKYVYIIDQYPTIGLELKDERR